MRQWADTADEVFQGAEAIGEAVLGQYRQEDDWYIDDIDMYRFFRDHSPPRPYGYLDQLKTDLRTSMYSRVTWIVMLSALVAGVVIGWYFLMITVALMMLFGPTFVQLAEIHSEAILVVSTENEIDAKPTLGETGFGNVTVQVGGESRTLRVSLPWKACKYLLNRDGSFECLVAMHPTKDFPGSVVGVRGVRGEHRAAG